MSVLLRIAVGTNATNPPARLFAGLIARLYAAGRLITEFYREPETANWLGMTRGQYLSVAIAVLGLGFLAYAWKQAKTSRLKTAK